MSWHLRGRIWVKEPIWLYCSDLKCFSILDLTPSEFISTQILQVFVNVNYSKPLDYFGISVSPCSVGFDNGVPWGCAFKKLETMMNGGEVHEESDYHLQPSSSL